jgi:predicted nucleic acid-binding Zn ribbon protein
MSDTPKPVPIAEALERYLARSGLARRIGQARVLEEWAELVGPQVAKVTEPESVTADGQLRVRVATAQWASELQLMTPQIIARLNAGRGQGRITGIFWIAAGTPARRRAGRPFPSHE